MYLRQCWLGHSQFAGVQGGEVGELRGKLGHAVPIEPRLPSKSPKNGNISNISPETIDDFALRLATQSDRTRLYANSLLTGKDTGNATDFRPQNLTFPAESPMARAFLNFIARNLAGKEIKITGL